MSLAPKWEYLVEVNDFNNPKSMDRLNERGAQGWELVTVNRFGQCIFKRTGPVAVTTVSIDYDRMPHWPASVPVRGEQQ